MEMKYERVRNVKSPARAHANDAGVDFFIPFEWNSGEPYKLWPQERVNIPSGIKVDVPKNHALIAFNKSGVAGNLGLDILACVVDSGYQGEVHISLVNTGKEPVELKGGMKITQFILLPIICCKMEEAMPGTLFLSGGTTRGAGGFGSTGNR